MTAVWVMRVARPTDRLLDISEMYAAGLGFTILEQFVDHHGFDGVILGHADHPYHLEFTAQRGHRVGDAPNQESLLVFYVPNTREWEERCARMAPAGFREVASHNPYWDVAGRTFEDLDGYRVVLQNAVWIT